MLKKRINKIKIKTKQKQKQMQIVNVNIHKPTRKQREGLHQPKRNVLPTPQYLYTSQTDNLVPQIFNKQGNQTTLNEQINKSIEETLNKIVSKYNILTQPTQEEVRQIRTSNFSINNNNNDVTNTSPPIDFLISPSNDLKPDIQPDYYYEKSSIKPIRKQREGPTIYKSEPETIKTIIQKPRTNIKKDVIHDDSNIYIPKEKTLNNNDNDLIISENTIPFIFNQQPISDNFLTVQNTPSRSIETTSRSLEIPSRSNERQGYTMYKPIEKITESNRLVNTDQYKIPTREEIRFLRNLNDYTKINPYNEKAIVPYIKENSIVELKEQQKLEEKLEPKVSNKKKSTQYVNTDTLNFPKSWIKKHNIKSKIKIDDYNELKNYAIDYKKGSQSEKILITKKLKTDFLPKVQNTKVKQMVNDIEQKKKKT